MDKKMLLPAGLAMAAAVWAAPMYALSVSDLIVFGDSNVDIGRLATELSGDPADGVVVPPNTVGGRSSDSTILPEFIADRVGISQQNYGWGGAQAGTDNIVGLLVPSATDVLRTGTLSQIDEFEAMLGGVGADANALYLVFAGSNDLFVADKNDQAEVDAAVSSADANLREAVTRLSDIGAKNIVVATRTPRPVLSDAATPTDETNPDARNDAAGRQLNSAIVSLVADLNSSLFSDVLLFDSYAIIRDLIDESGTNGFDLYSSAPEDYCQPPSGPRQADCSSLINYDSAHKTSAVHSALADSFISQFDLEAATAAVPLPAGGWLLLTCVVGLAARARLRAV